jgi:hypothetical protein
MKATINLSQDSSVLAGDLLNTNQKLYRCANPLVKFPFQRLAINYRH